MTDPKKKPIVDGNSGARFERAVRSLYEQTIGTKSIVEEKAKPAPAPPPPLDE